MDSKGRRLETVTHPLARRVATYISASKSIHRQLPRETDMITEELRNSDAFKELFAEERKKQYPLLVFLVVATIFSFLYVQLGSKRGFDLRSFDPAIVPNVWLAYGAAMLSVLLGVWWMKRTRSRFEAFVDQLSQYGELKVVFQQLFDELENHPLLQIDEYSYTKNGGWQVTNTLIVTKHWLCIEGKIARGKWMRVDEVAGMVVDQYGRVDLMDKADRSLTFRIQIPPSRDLMQSSRFFSPNAYHNFDPDFSRLTAFVSILEENNPGFELDGFPHLTRTS